MNPVAVKVSGVGTFAPARRGQEGAWSEGTCHVVITVADGQATLTTMAENLVRIRALARPYAPKDRLASGELIAERREEARREDARQAPAAPKPSAKRRAGG